MFDLKIARDARKAKQIGCRSRGRCFGLCGCRSGRQQLRGAVVSDRRRGFQAQGGFADGRREFWLVKSCRAFRVCSPALTVEGI